MVAANSQPKLGWVGGWGGGGAAQYSLTELLCECALLILGTFFLLLKLVSSS
jgi:hypothetical protein